MIAFVLGGCAGGSGASTPPAGGASASSSGRASSAVSRQQWQVALTALGPSYSPQTPTFDPAALARWNAFLAQGWYQLRWRIEPIIDGYVRQEIASLSGGTMLSNIRSITYDTAAAPAFASGGGSGAAQTLIANLPGAAQGWSLAIDADATWNPQFHVAGILVSPSITIAVTIHVDDVRVVQPVDFDMTNPARPLAKSVGTPQLAMRLSVTSPSQDPLVSQATAAITTALDPIVRAALLVGAATVQQQMGTAISGVPQQPWGLGGPAITTVSPSADLLAVADGVTDEILRVHLPFATNIFPIVFDQPGYGNGNPVDITDIGDTAIWTGHYVMAEALRYELTGDPRALRGATTALDGITADLDIDGPGSGLLARCAIPVANPHISAISGWGAVYYGRHDGVPMGGLGYISRDQYIGAMLGAEQSFLRIPALRPAAKDIITRVVGYLAANDWGAYDHNAPVVVAGFTPNPDVLWAFLKCANLVDRANWGYTHDQNVDLASIFWFPIWISSREVHDGYYKFNLMHSTAALMVAAEADPLVYREYLKGLEVMHDVTGHHQNAWFDGVYAVAVPSAAPLAAPLLESELQHWALRPRRNFNMGNSADPSIAKTLYTPASIGGGQPHWVADKPIPLEKRVAGDFLWQTDPFQLDGAGDGRTQYPGIDLILPYWVGRSFGLLR